MKQDNTLPVVVIGGVMNSMGGIVSVVVDTDGVDWFVAFGIKNIFFF